MRFLAESQMAVDHDVRQSKLELIAQVVGIMGISKMLLAMFGNGTAAATLEALADELSKREYRALRQEAGDNSSRPRYTAE